MNELIRIKLNENGENIVSARELHEFLGSRQDFTTWLKSRIDKYGFVEDEDFTLHKKMVGKTWKHDYILKLDMAKELSMVEANEKGQLARKYFIEIEKKYALAQSKPKVPQTYAQALLEAGRLALENEQLQLTIQTKNNVIDSLTEDLDPTIIRKIATDYVNECASRNNQPQHVLWNSLYGLVGRHLKIDIKTRHANHIEKIRERVISNKEFNKVNKLEIQSGECQKAIPCTLKEANGGMSVIEFVCTELKEGKVLLQMMAKIFHVKIEDIIEKYNFA